MKTHEELISLIGNMFTDTYVAGARNDLVSFLDAKAQREELFAAVKDLYEEIADRGIRINDLLHELHHYREDVAEERRRSHVDDADKFSEQDLPFPDVEDPDAVPADPDEYLKREV